MTFLQVSVEKCKNVALKDLLIINRLALPRKRKIRMYCEHGPSHFRQPI